MSPGEISQLVKNGANRETVQPCYAAKGSKDKIKCTDGHCYNPSTGYSWCVDENETEVEGTRKSPGEISQLVKNGANRETVQPCYAAKAIGSKDKIKCTDGHCYNPSTGYPW